MKLVFKAFLISIPLFIMFSGCTYGIKYKLSDIEKIDNSKYRNNSVFVASFEDKRGRLNSDAKVGRYFLNAEHKYEGIVSEEITRCFVQHLASKHIFKNVLIGDNDTSDFIIYCTISKFDGQKRESPFHNISFIILSNLFDLINLFLKTDVLIKIEFTDIRLVDKSTGNVINSIPSIKRHFKEKLPYRRSVYTHLNDKLKVVIEDLIVQLVKSD